MFMVVIVTPETIPVNFFLINCCLVPRLWFVCGKDNQGGPWHLVTYLISKPYLSSIRVDPKTICFFLFFLIMPKPHVIIPRLSDQNTVSRSMPMIRLEWHCQLCQKMTQSPTFYFFVFWVKKFNHIMIFQFSPKNMYPRAPATMAHYHSRQCYLDLFNTF